VTRSAAFSRDQRFRYALRRTWDPSGPTVLFVGLNPSTADHRQDDATIRRCVGFSKAMGFGQLLVANLFAFRTPHPRVLRRAADPVGPRNDRWLKRLAGEADLVVAAWGSHGSFLARDQDVIPLLGEIHCLGITARGQPRHPLYLPKAASLRRLAV
jgi:hypothetical protein